MDFSLTEEQQATYQMAHDFGAAEVAPMPVIGSRSEPSSRAMFCKLRVRWDWAASMSRRIMAARA